MLEIYLNLLEGLTILYLWSCRKIQEFGETVSTKLIPLLREIRKWFEKISELSRFENTYKRHKWSWFFQNYLALKRKFSGKNLNYLAMKRKFRGKTELSRFYKIRWIWSENDQFVQDRHSSNNNSNNNNILISTTTLLLHLWQMYGPLLTVLQHL